MSLLILSNRQEEYDVKQTGVAGSEVPTDTGIQKPYNFTNRLTNAQIIPRNSRIAVQSCKINKEETFSLKDATSFAIYLGEPVDATDPEEEISISETNSTPIQVILKQGVYSYDQMAEEIQRALNEALAHPDYYNNVLITPHFDSNDIFAGFRYDFCSKGASNASDQVLNLTTWGAAHPDTLTTSANITTTDGKLSIVRSESITNGSVYRCSLVCEDHPISALNKEFIVDLFHTNYLEQGSYDFSCFVGLTRPKVDYGLHGKNYAPPWFRFSSNTGIPHRSVYCDYSVHWAPKADGTWVLRVHNVQYDPTTKHTTTGEIAYWTGSGRVSSHIVVGDLYNAATESAGYGGRFKWVVRGEKLDLFIASYDSAGEFSEWTLLCGLASDDLSNNFVPINQNKWVLYPQIGLVKNTHQAYIEKFESAPMPKTASYGMKINAYDEDMWGLDSRSQQEAGNTANKMISGLDTTAESGAWAYALIFKKLPDNFTKKGVYQSKYGGSYVAGKLGFKNSTFRSSIADGNSKRVDRTTSELAPAPCWIITSAQPPLSESSSMFVKCPSLTAKNINYSKTLPSQILQHIPRFTSDGKSSGNMWWESNQLVYTRLKNAEPISLNDLTIQLVDKNERECKDLVGETIICLHIDEDLGGN